MRPIVNHKEAPLTEAGSEPLTALDRNGFASDSITTLNRERHQGRKNAQEKARERETKKKKRISPFSSSLSVSVGDF